MSIQTMHVIIQIYEPEYWRSLINFIKKIGNLNLMLHKNEKKLSIIF